MTVDIDLEFEKILTSIDNLLDDCQVHEYDKEFDRLSRLQRIVQNMYNEYPTDGYWMDDEDEDKYNYGIERLGRYEEQD